MVAVLLQRNYITKLRKSSKKKDLFDQWGESEKKKDAWDTVKPLLSTKNRGTRCDIVLKE